MKVVFLEDVEGVAQGGEVKEVKRGFARNYLIPQRLAMPATRDSLQRIDRLKKQAEERRLRTISDMKQLAEELGGKRVDVPMRAGAGGRLYGSVTNAIVPTPCPICSTVRLSAATFRYRIRYERSAHSTCAFTSTPTSTPRSRSSSIRWRQTPTSSYDTSKNAKRRRNPGTRTPPTRPATRPPPPSPMTSRKPFPRQNRTKLQSPKSLRKSGKLSLRRSATASALDGATASTWLAVCS